MTNCRLELMRDEKRGKIPPEQLVFAARGAIITTLCHQTGKSQGVRGPFSFELVLCEEERS